MKYINNLSSFFKGGGRGAEGRVVERERGGSAVWGPTSNGTRSEETHCLIERDGPRTRSCERESHFRFRAESNFKVDDRSCFGGIRRDKGEREWRERAINKSDGFCCLILYSCVVYV